jgi:hypothetical protein
MREQFGIDYSADYDRTSPARFPEDFMRDPSD